MQGRICWAAAICVAAVMAGCGSSSSSSSSNTAVAGGTYQGTVHCSGGDRFSAGRSRVAYSSAPRASVTVGGGGRLERWTYFFLGRPDTVIQASAVRPGDSFTYAAGTHIGRAGSTRVTVAEAPVAGSDSRLTATMDWSSPATGYSGAGTYTLLVDRVSSTRIRYHAEKVVLKAPSGSSSAANPLVRRNETCIGELSR